MDFINKIANFWKSLGAKVLNMSSENHDRIVCYTSYLPHLIASNLSNTLSRCLTNEEIMLKVYGNGLLDTTRIAEGDPAMWLDIFMPNQQNLLLSIKQFQQTLTEVELLIMNNKAEDIFNYLSAGRDFRIKNCKLKLIGYK